MTLADDRFTTPSLRSSTPTSTARKDGHSLDERFTRRDGTVYLTGIQALVRMIADRARLDRRTGIHTASFVSGYEGSPLAGYDLELARRRALLAPLDVVHRPGVNEELAATSVMGSQLAAAVTDLAPTRSGPHADPRPRDGIVGYWYGKAPGLDRAADALRHANLIGTPAGGGAVAIVGDDPGAKSSTVPSSSEMSLADLYLPVLAPADPQDILDLGVHAALMSRVSGLWTSLKIAAHVADGGATAALGRDRLIPRYGDLGPSQHLPSGRLLGSNLLEAERSQLEVRMPRAVEYARLNGINRIVARTSDDRIGIIAAGKTYLDMREALRIIGIDDADLGRLGIRILKLGMVYPIERGILHRFIDGLDDVIVVEEKRDFIETMLRDILFRHPGAPRIVGKATEDGATLFSRFGELDADTVARGLARRLGTHGIEAATAWQQRRRSRPTRIELPLAVRTPYFCSGCPHNSSTKVSDASLVGAGIGCHAMVLLMDPTQVGDVTGVTQMGGEGAQWLGMAPFVEAEHFVQNIGDGTFAHSGSLALRAAIAAEAKITYKLLYNGTVAMTGGQNPVGEMDLRRLTELLHAEGVARIVVTSDDPRRTRSTLRRGLRGPAGISVRHRNDLTQVQAELAAVDGVTVLIHDQACAAQLRRKRKRAGAAQGPLAALPAPGAHTPTQRIMINERICEGCGDCGEKSNCLSVHPVDTDFGRKTRIDQSSCNLDASCLNGDCPSFMTVTPATTTAPRQVAADIDTRQLPPAPAPSMQRRDRFSVRITGIGGTGVVTTSQVLATAAVLDGSHARTVDMTGLAQKGGAVIGDLRITSRPVEEPAKVAEGDCDLYLACDSLVGTDPKNLAVADGSRTTAVVSTARIPTGAMVIDSSVGFPADARIHDAIDSRVARAVYLNPIALADTLFGDEQFANMIMVGAAYQAGALPMSASTIEAAIDLNGVAVATNVQAFRRGRQAVGDPNRLEETLRPHSAAPTQVSQATAEAVAETFGDVLDAEHCRQVALRVDDLIGHSGKRYARSYLDTVARIQRDVGSSELTVAVAGGLHKLMAYKDEYEVARLTADANVAAAVAEEFGANATVAVRLHPPTLRSLGMKRKLSLGPWARLPLASLARLRKLRGTPFDPFGYNEIRRTERALITEYRQAIEDAVRSLKANSLPRDRLPDVIAMAELPDMVRGYEQVKMRNVIRYRRELDRQRTALAPAAGTAT